MFSIPAFFRRSAFLSDFGCPCMFGFWVSVYVLPHDSCYTVLSNLTIARCRSACMSRGVPQLRVRHTDGFGIQRLVKLLSALLFMHRIGDTDGSVPLLLSPNTFAPSASDTTSSKNLSRIPVCLDEVSLLYASPQVISTSLPVESAQLFLSLLLKCYQLLV